MNKLRCHNNPFAKIKRVSRIRCTGGVAVGCYFITVIREGLIISVTFEQK